MNDPFHPDVRRAIDTLRVLQQRADAGWPGGFDPDATGASALAAVAVLDRYATTPADARKFLDALGAKPQFRATVASKRQRA